MASCITPYGVRDRLTNDTIPVPCGRCPPCVARRISGWSFRLLQEEKISSSAWFITLTYSTSTVPITSRGFMSIDKRHCQLFMKRLRKAHPSGTRLKYFLAAEYGSQGMRPHYHMILFNADYRLIQDSWAMGQVHYGSVTGASVGYTLKYMQKPPQIPKHRNDDRTPEFRLMSKGMGANYLTDNMVKWHLSDLDNRMYCNLAGGGKISMPRYYKSKLFSSLYFETDDLATVLRKRVGMIARRKMIAEELERERKGGAMYFRNLAEAHIACFKRMHYHSLQNQKL